MILQEVYLNIKDHYHIKLLAGEGGMETSIDWVHSIEDKEVASFLHGDELVLTTGIANAGEAWILAFVTELYHKHACGILINVGPYIKEIPESVITFCKRHDFPLFLVPWEVRLVDITKEISSMIFDQEKERITLVNSMKDAIFYPEEESSYCNPLKRHGYLIEKAFCPILMEIQGCRLDEDGRNHTLELLKYMVTFRFSKAVFFSLSKYYVVILYQGDKEEIKECIDLIRKFDNSNQAFRISSLIVGPNSEDIRKLHQSYQVACRMSNLAKKKKEKVLDFRQLGTYQLLLNVQNLDLMKGYFCNILGDLKKEDEENGTELFDLFRTYLETDCSVQQTAGIYYCHRNTINQRIHHIREILGITEIDIFKKLEFMMAYEVYDIIR